MQAGYRLTAGTLAIHWDECQHRIIKREMDIWDLTVCNHEHAVKRETEIIRINKGTEEGGYHDQDAIALIITAIVMRRSRLCLIDDTFSCRF